MKKSKLHWFFSYLMMDNGDADIFKTCQQVKLNEYYVHEGKYVNGYRNNIKANFIIANL